MIRISLLILLCMSAGCHSGSEPKRMAPEYTNYTFDKKVMAKIPVYDSLVSAIVEVFPAFQKRINAKESYNYYHYIPSSDDVDVTKELPEGTANVSRIYKELGKDFIYGFDVFKDSTVKIYVKSTFSGTLQVDINENLSYYPAGKNIKRREFPTKDTLLNNNWQYWIVFDERGLF